MTLRILSNILVVGASLVTLAHGQMRGWPDGSPSALGRQHQRPAGPDDGAPSPKRPCVEGDAADHSLSRGGNLPTDAEAAQILSSVASVETHQNGGGRPRNPAQEKEYNARITQVLRDNQSNSILQEYKSGLEFIKHLMKKAISHLTSDLKTQKDLKAHVKTRYNTANKRIGRQLLQKVDALTPLSDEQVTKSLQDEPTLQMITFNGSDIISYINLLRNCNGPDANKRKGLANLLAAGVFTVADLAVAGIPFDGAEKKAAVDFLEGSEEPVPQKIAGINFLAAGALSREELAAVGINLTDADVAQAEVLTLNRTEKFFYSLSNLPVIEQPEAPTVNPLGGAAAQSPAFHAIWDQESILGLLSLGEATDNRGPGAAPQAQGGGNRDFDIELGHRLIKEYRIDFEFIQILLRDAYCLLTGNSSFAKTTASVKINTRKRHILGQIPQYITHRNKMVSQDRTTHPKEWAVLLTGDEKKIFIKGLKEPQKDFELKGKIKTYCLAAGVFTVADLVAAGIPFDTAAREAAIEFLKGLKGPRNQKLSATNFLAAGALSREELAVAGINLTDAEAAEAIKAAPVAASAAAAQSGADGFSLDLPPPPEPLDDDGHSKSPPPLDLLGDDDDDDL